MGKHLSIKTANFPRTFKKSLKGLPANIVKRAHTICDSLNAGAPLSDYQSKRLNINRDVIVLNIGMKHRLLLAETSEGTINPWMCLTHESYNQQYMRISTS